jgi:hypothetical protein
VIVDLGAADRAEMLFLTIPQARVLVSQLLDGLLAYIEREREDGGVLDAINVCDVPLTYNETNDLMNRLDQIVYMHELTGGRRAVHSGPGVDWQHEGF